MFVRLLIAMMMAGLLLPMTQGAAATADASVEHALQTDADIAAATAVLLSEYEASGDFHALYDWIHPDAHAVVSRAAVVGWFQNEYYPRGPGVATVTGVRFVDWTWPVTGVTYTNVAEVSFTQPFHNEGHTIQDVVRLVPFEGTYRWFFGRSAEFVADVTARYGIASAPPPPAASMSLESYVNFIHADLDAFWSGVLGWAYRPPALQFTQGGEWSPCGVVDAYTPAAYCAGSETIYINAVFAEETLFYVEYALAYMIAHEFGHHIQMLDGSLVPWRDSVDIELEADCYAGVWSLDVDTRGLLEANDTDEVLMLIEGVGGFSPATHGTTAQRTASYLAGYYNGLMGCATF